MASTQQILDGPSRHDLIFAFLYAFDKQHTHRITMKIKVYESESEEAVRITSLTHASRTGRDFRFEGVINNTKIKGQYDTKLRRGSFVYVVA